MYNKSKFYLILEMKCNEKNIGCNVNNSFADVSRAYGAVWYDCERRNK